MEDKESCAYKMKKQEQREYNKKNYELKKSREKQNEEGGVMCPDYSNYTYVYKKLNNNLQPA